MRSLALLVALTSVVAGQPSAATSRAAAPSRLVISAVGAVADGKTVNTAPIQAAIDQLAAAGGGTVVVPRGVFVSGALFFKQGVSLALEKEAVLQCSTDMKHFPPQRTRIEGHYEESFNPALINVDQCDGFRLSGEGTLDGAGRPIWDAFWKLRDAAPDRLNFKNLSVPRARLCLIQRSNDVTVEGITFKDSQFWNLHLFRCRNVRVENTRFVVPDDYRQAPSSDGIDVDSCQDVAIQGCFFSVTDDCIALKGAKGPFALDDKDSPPVERVRVTDCTFKRGHAAVTLGSEATVVRDVLVQNCRVLGPMTVANFKLRSDTPQHYENIHYRDITIESSSGAVVSMRPWRQYIDLQGQPPPQSRVHNVTLTNFRGHTGSFGLIEGNPGQTEIGDVTFENIEVRLKNPRLTSRGVKNLVMKGVLMHSGTGPSPSPGP